MYSERSDPSDNSVTEPQTVFEQLDGYATLMSGYAGVYAQYYNTLIRDKVPPDLAFTMARDFAWMSQAQRMYPMFPPPVSPSLR